MAMYHFSVHKDKKPDKTKVSCVEHLEYIERKGKYQNQDKPPNNFISFANGKDLLDGEPLLLYDSAYGQITNTPHGLKISGDSSEATIAIALTIAAETYKNETVILRGSNAFKEKALDSILKFNIDITLDEESKRTLAKKMEEEQNERREFRLRGGKYIKRRATQKHDTPIHDGRGRTLSQSVSLSPPTLRTLPKRSMDNTGSGKPAMLLQDHFLDLLEHRRSELDSHVRWNNRDGRGRLIRGTAGRIIANIEKAEDKVHAFSHVEYINREAAFEKKGGCIYTENRLPKWAKGDAKRFFAAADRYESKKNVRYLEFQFALPNELTMEQNLELIHNYIDKEIPDHYYTFAIHDKVGAMSDGSHNLHVHLMFSPRIIDEAEQEKERPASKYFLYPKRNAKTLEEARKGGAHVERRLSAQRFISEARRDFAEVTNDILEKYGKPDRVDHRSIKAMREEALMNGDEFMANILKRIPERTLGPIGSMKTESQAYKALKQYRQQKREYQDKLFSTEIIRKEINELELKKEIDELRDLADELMRRNDFEEIEEDEDSDEFMAELKNDFLDALKQMKIDEKTVLWVDDAVTEGKLAFLEEDEKEQYQKYLALTDEIEHWKEFYASIDPDESTPDYLKLLSPIQTKIEAMEHLKEHMEPAIQLLDKKLTQPELKERRQKYVHNLLEEDKNSRIELKKSLKRLRTSMLSLTQALDSGEDLINNQESYTLRDLYNIMRKRYYAAKNEYQKAREEEEEAAKKYISPERATKMAEDVFVKGEYKVLRSERRALKKEQEKLQAQIGKLAEAEHRLGKFQPGTEEHLALSDECHRLKKEIESTRSTLESKESSLNKKEAELRAKCEAPGAPEKIKEITAGILRKNLPQARIYETAKKRTQLAHQKYMEAGKNLNGIKEAMDKERATTRYTVAKSGGSSGGGIANLPPITPQFSNLDRPTIITAAINGNAMAKNIVSMKSDDTAKNWKLMSVFEQEEEQEKAFKRLL